MKETAFGKKFIAEMQNKFPLLWGLKVHGQEMQASFIPDYLFCINSYFVGIEFKVQRDYRISITPGQIKELIKIQNAKGIGLIIAYDEDRNKILIRSKRLDYKAIFLDGFKPVKSGNIKIEWDFEFVHYNDAVDLLQVLVENN